ncbi:SDR family NAD(P)-dependent oxidoreductase [Kaistia dalseonensis]|uniref:Dihydroanticapsin dehydrogenase n=1 Tax=Kaistia dalseonensis TaxID=410840 RepID=A0ABU0H7C0_9HYPH|nr:SDR family NAD(P)-dependent oxidoreductase [Kaistia dalseonensis]MCX5495608.1 SDR family NAD(P)-dependent oxidoreductase [Kaistia dalseonensis]MDQ0438201.1 dihydroanticapsin dehydrogenase [Kaistia dalseonensis]
MARLANKRVLVIGAASGIGRAVAEAAVAEGARVVIADLAEEAGRATAQAIGPACDFLRCDVGDEESIVATVAEAAARLGGLDGLVNNAGLMRAGPLESMTANDWDRMMAVNGRGVFIATREAIRHLKASGGGSVVNTASLAAKRGGPGISGYAATKGAVMAFTTAAALELAPHKIRVNSVCPGFIDTPFNNPAIDFMGGRAEQEKIVKIMVPLGRQAIPEEVAPLYVYLLSDESGYVTAQALSIDGGVYN